MAQVLQELIHQTSRLVLDKEKEIRLAVTCLLAGGHLLIEDVPGVGKTTLVQTLARLSGLKTHRIQFTVDLLPGDIIGGQVYHAHEHRFEFHPGPLFAQMILADELNRASPRTQGALLQAMEEQEVAVDGVNHVLPKPFFVVATQNPHQQQGTFPLPESQLDRFLMSLELNYASAQTEIELFKSRDTRDRMGELQPVLKPDEFIQMMRKAQQETAVSDPVAKYVSDILTHSRRPSLEALPLSTRAGLALIRSAKANAFIEGRDYLRPDDIQSVLIPVLGHRLGGTHGLRKGREWAAKLLRETSVPL